MSSAAKPSELNNSNYDSSEENEYYNPEEEIQIAPFQTVSFFYNNR